MFQLAEIRPLQQRLVLLDGAPDLTLFAIEVAEDRVGFRADLRRAPRLSPARRSPAIDLIGHQEVEARACNAATRGRGADRSSGRRAACSVPRPCRWRGRPAAPAGRREMTEPSISSSRQYCCTIVVPASLGAQHQLDQFAGGAAASVDRANPVHRRAHLGRRVGRRGRQSRPAPAPAGPADRRRSTTAASASTRLTGMIAIVGVRLPATPCETIRIPSCAAAAP